MTGPFCFCAHGCPVNLTHVLCEHVAAALLIPNRRAMLYALEDQGPLAAAPSSSCIMAAAPGVLTG